MRAALVPILAGLLAASAAPQEKPDFTGTWRLDPERTPGAARDRTDTWIVTQTADTLTLVDASSRSDPRIYRLDGTPTEAVDLLTGRWIYRTLWLGDRLVIASEGERPGSASTETWSLDEQGWLVIEWQRDAQGGRPALVHRYRKVGDPTVSRPG